MAAALEREALQAEVVETAALRRCDELKTALLRAVSHDLRSPLTAIVAAGRGARLAGLDAEDRASSRPRSSSEGAGSRAWSRSCSTSRACRPAPRSRGATGRSIDEVMRAARRRRRRRPERVELALDRTCR